MEIKKRPQKKSKLKKILGGLLFFAPILTVFSMCFYHKPQETLVCLTVFSLLTLALFCMAKGTELMSDEDEYY